MVLLQVFSPYPFSITFPDNFMVNPHVDISWYSSKFSLILSFLIDFFHQISIFWRLHLLFPFLSHISNELEPSFHINLSQLSWVSSLFSRPGANFPILTGGYAGYGGKGLAKGWQPPARKPPPTVPADYQADAAGQDHCLLVGSNRGFPGSSWGEYNGI